MGKGGGGALLEDSVSRLLSSSGHLTPQFEEALLVGDLSGFVAHLVLQRKKIPLQVLAQVEELLAGHLDPDYAELLSQVIHDPARRLSAPKALRTLLLTLGSQGQEQSRADYFSPKLGGRPTLAQAIQTEIRAWGQADVYLDFPRGSRSSLRLGSIPRPHKRFTFAMWFSMDELVGKGAEPVTIFRFLGGGGGKSESGMEAVLEYWGDDVWQLVYRSICDGTAHTVRETLSFTRGAWQLLAISHTQPYLSLIKGSQVKVALDGHVINVRDLPYPSPKVEGETFRQCVLVENLAGRVAGATLYMDKVVTDDVMAMLYRAGPNLPHLSHPAMVPTAAVEDPITPLASELYGGRAAEEAAQYPISFCIHAGWTTPRSPPDSWVLLPPQGSAKLDHWTLVKPTPSARVAGGGVDRSSTVVAITTGSVTLHQSDWGLDGLFPVGGVSALLAIATDTAGSAAEPGYIVDLMGVLAELLSRHPSHREAFLQAYGFHVLACLLRKKSDATSAQCLTTRAVDTSLAVLEACGSERAGQLFWAAVQGLLLDWDLWSRAPPETQVHLLQRVGDVVSRNIRAFRQCMGAQGLLDLLRLHVCVSPDPLRTPGGRKSLERPEQAQLVELCEPLLVAVIEQGYYEKRAAMGTVSFDIGPVGSDNGGGRSDIAPLLRCLHETKSYYIQISILRVLVSVRAAHGDLLWRDLVRQGYDRHVSYLLLTRRGYAEDVRRLAVDLFVWTLQVAGLTPAKLAAWVALGNPGKAADYHHTFDDGTTATSRDEDLQVFLENYRRLSEVASWVAGGVQSSVDSGAWGSRVGSETVETLVGREDREWPLWAALPLMAAILPLAPAHAQQSGLTKVNMKLKVDERSRKEVLTAGMDFWLAPLLAMAALGARTEGVGRFGGEAGGGGAGDWEDVHAFGDGAVSASEREAASISDELSLDALASLLHEEMLRDDSRNVGLWTRLVEEIGRVNARLHDANWGRVVLQRLCAMVLQRIARSGALFSSGTIRALLKVLSIIEERIFPLSFTTPPLTPSTAPVPGAASDLVDAGFGLVEPARPVLSQWESRLLSVVLELVRYLRNGSAGSGPTTTRPAEGNYLPALLVASRLVMSVLGRLQKLSQAQGAVEELCGMVHAILNGRSFDPSAAKETLLLLFASLRQAIAQLTRSSATQDEEDMRQVLNTLVIVLVSDYSSPVDLGSTTAVLSETARRGGGSEAGGLPCRRAVAEMLAPAVDQTTADAIFRALQAQMDAAVDSFVKETESLVSNLGDSGFLSAADGKDADKAGGGGDKEELGKEFSAAHKSLVESERSRLSGKARAQEEERQAMDDYWDRTTRSIRFECLGLMPKAGDLHWALDGEQGLMPARRRVLLTPVLKPPAPPKPAAKGRRAPTPPSEGGPPLVVNQDDGFVDGGPAVLQQGESIDAVGKALALQLGGNIRDVTVVEEVEGQGEGGGAGGGAGGKEDEKWSLLGEPKEGGAMTATMKDEHMEGCDLEDSDEEGGSDRPPPDKAPSDRASGDGGPPLVVSMGLRTRQDRTVGEGERVREDGVSLVTPRRVYRGTIVLTTSYLYFFRDMSDSEAPAAEPSAKPAEAPAGGSASPETRRSFAKDGETIEKEEAAGEMFSRQRWYLPNVSGIYLRRYRLRDTALEIFLRRGRSRTLFVDFGRSKADMARRDQFTTRLSSVVPGHAWHQWPRSAPDELLRKFKVTQAWKRREISNYDYLMALNTIAGRSFNDLSQYPVFPWILSNYTSQTIDLSDPANYRDLSKPMGALNEERLREFLERYEGFSDPSIPKFMYGSHYSTAAGVVLHYLVRLQPFADLHKEMQGGMFDVADRLFGSVPRSWRMNTSELSEVKELTPEWFSLPDFLRNVNNLQLGETQDGTKVGDVILPPWAPTAEDFIRIQREALESEHVSQNLHHWVDLIFGHKQRGPAAVEARNVFFYLTYYGAVDVSQIEDEGLRNATEMQIAYFGQCPIQLFQRPHPARDPCPVIYRPLRSLLRQGMWVPTSAITAEQRMASWTLPEPVVLQEADSHLVYVKVLPGRVLTVNQAGVVNSYTWSCATRQWDAPRGASGEPPLPPLPPSECLSPPAGLAAEPPPLRSPQSGVTLPPLPSPSAAGPRGSSTSAPPPPSSSLSSTSRSSSGGAGSNDPSRPQILRLGLERDKTPIEFVPRVPPPVLTSDGGRRPPGGGSFAVHISRTGRFILGGGDPFGSIHVLEVDVEQGHVTGEGLLMGHQAAVTCISTAGMEETGMELVLTGSQDCTAMVWRIQRIQRILGKVRKPYVVKRPDRVLRGHTRPVVGCAISVTLGVTVTCSDLEVLVHGLEDVGLVRRIRLASSFVDRGYRYRHCLLSDDGLIVVSMHTADYGQQQAASRIQVWTVNGNILAERDVAAPLARLQLLGRAASVLMAVRVDGVVDMMDTSDLSAVGCYRLAGGRWPGDARGPPPALECADAGPDAVTPILLACGTGEGSLLVVGLPLLHFAKDLEAANHLANVLFNIKIVKDTVNIALNTFGRARGIASQAKDVVLETFGEAKTIVKDVSKKGLQGLVSGLFGSGGGGGGAGGNL